MLSPVDAIRAMNPPYRYDPDALLQPRAKNVWLAVAFPLGLAYLVVTIVERVTGQQRRATLREQLAFIGWQVYPLVRALLIVHGLLALLLYMMVFSASAQAWICAHSAECVSDYGPAQHPVFASIAYVPVGVGLALLPLFVAALTTCLAVLTRAAREIAAVLVIAGLVTQAFALLVTLGAAATGSIGVAETLLTWAIYPLWSLGAPVALLRWMIGAIDQSAA